MEISERYRIDKPLGKKRNGKFGKVFLVTDKAFGRKGVMKAIRKDRDSEHLVARLKYEAKYNFDHKGLPQILDTYESDTEFIVIRNYAEGKPLDEAWNAINKRDRHQFLVHVLKELSVILEYLETEFIVHCDIKPGNILVTDAGEVSLIDFGLALRKDAIDQRNILFPLGYAAPELLLNRLHLVDKRTDYFAIGILIWRLYAGKLPLAHPNPSVFTNLQLTHPLPDSTDVPTNVQPLIEKLSAKYPFGLPPNRMQLDDVDKCLVEGMNRRYSDFKVFLKEFSQAKPSSWFKKRGLF